MKYKKILVIGAYGSCNFGDDLLMIVVYRMLKQVLPESCIAFACSKQKYIHKIDNSLVIDDSFDARKYDLIVYGGGTQVFSFSFISVQGTRFYRFTKKIFGLLENPERVTGAIKRLLLKRKTEVIKPCIGLGLGFGPFENKSQAMELIQKKLGSQCKLLFVRDKDSYIYSKQANYNPILITDVCFATAINSFMPNIQKRKKINRIGLLLRDWSEYDDILFDTNSIKKILDYFYNKSIEVVMISFSCQHDIRWRSIINKTNCETLFWEPEKMTISTFLSDFNTVDLLVSSRYHGLVFATLLEIPFIPVSIEPKIDNFVIENFFKDYTWKNPFETEELFLLLQKAEHEYLQMKKEIFKLKYKYVDDAKKYQNKLKGFFDE